MKEFRDNDGQIYIKNENGIDARIPVNFFLRLEPDYKSPSEGATRLYNGAQHTIIGKDTQRVAKDLSEAILEGYISKVKDYRAAYGNSKKSSDAVTVYDWEGLENSFRNSPAWSKVFYLMTQDPALNASGTLVMMSITTTKNIADLIAGWQALTSLIDATDNEGFTEEEILLIKQGLIDNQFPLEPFGFTA